MWCHQESNRGHKDFQSFALPTELWHHTRQIVILTLASAKVHHLYQTTKFLLIKVIIKIKKSFCKGRRRSGIKNKNFVFCFVIPLTCTTFAKESGCSAVGSALRSGRRCRQFESGHPDIKGARKNIISPCAFSFKYNPTLKAIEEDIIKVQTSDLLSLHRAHYTR